MSRPADQPVVHPGVPHRSVAGGVPTPDIDLGAPPATIPPRPVLDAEIRDAIAGLVARAPGCAMRSLAYESTPVATRSAHLRLTIAGWSPSLHALDQHVLVHAPRDRDGDIDVEQLLRALVPAVSTQAARAASARHMGVHAPLPVGLPSTIEMRHLLVDASLPALLEAAGERPAELLAEQLHALHTGSHSLGAATSGDGTPEAGAHLGSGSSHVIECGLGRMLGATAHVDLSERLFLSFDGLALQVSGLPALPEAALIQARGRPFRDVVAALHPALDDRIVVEATNEGRQLHVRFEPKLLDWRDWGRA